MIYDQFLSPIHLMKYSLLKKVVQWKTIANICEQSRGFWHLQLGILPLIDLCWIWRTFSSEQNKYIDWQPQDSLSISPWTVKKQVFKSHCSLIFHSFTYIPSVSPKGRSMLIYNKLFSLRSAPSSPQVIDWNENDSFSAKPERGACQQQSSRHWLPKRTQI